MEAIVYLLLMAALYKSVARGLNSRTIENHNVLGFQREIETVKR